MSLLARTASVQRKAPARIAQLVDRLRLVSPADRAVLGTYLLTRIGIWLTAWAAVWLFPADGRTQQPAQLRTVFEQWDWHHFLDVARDGYFPNGAGPWLPDWDHREAFFPGFPLALRAVHTVIGDWLWAGLLISFISGAVAVLALARIVRMDRPGTKADRTVVLMLLTSPCAIFLAVGYSEALFLALALPAWLAARRHRWGAASVLCALATGVRITGLFVAAAIVVQFLVDARVHRNWRILPWFAAPVLVVLGYWAYLFEYTGDWNAWRHAQEHGWARSATNPIDAWTTTWEAAFGKVQLLGYAGVFQAELVAMSIGLLLLIFLSVTRRWAEATYLLLNLVALGTSYWYMSIPRTTLLWWPLWTALAGIRHPLVRTTYLCVVAPLSTIFALAFLTSRWAS